MKFCCNTVKYICKSFGKHGAITNTTHSGRAQFRNTFAPVNVKNYIIGEEIHPMIGQQHVDTFPRQEFIELVTLVSILKIFFKNQNGVRTDFFRGPKWACPFIPTGRIHQVCVIPPDFTPNCAHPVIVGTTS